jgi:hypothetical protein
MLQTSLKAILNVLKTEFPTVPIYINQMPEQFKRPSFFIMLVLSNDDTLNKKHYKMKATWQIVYFGAQDSFGNKDTFSQYTMLDSLKSLFMDDLIITAPDKTIFDIVSVDGSIRESEVYMTVGLEAQNIRTETASPLIGDVEINLKEE